MPTVAITGQTTFGANTSGTTTQLDNNFLLCLNALNSFNQYSNYLVDSGAANAYVVTAPASTTATLAAGLPIQFKAANANTAASTLNATGVVKNILNVDGSALAPGQIAANSIISVMYDGTQYLLIGASAPAAFGASWVKLAAATSGSVATVDLTLTSGFGSYFLDIIDVTPATDASDLWIRASEDSGATFKAGATDYAHTRMVNTDASVTPAGGGSTGDTKIVIAGSLGNGATKPFNGLVKIGQPANTAKHKPFVWSFAYTSSGNAILAGCGGAKFQLDTNAINAIRVMMSSGNINLTYALYGVRNS